MNDHPAPLTCPECARVFAWGVDADSAIVDKQGEQWLSCLENGYWKLQFHFQEEHADKGFQCARRTENFQHRKGIDFWNTHDGHRACSYCGSMHPDDFFAAIDAGGELGPTDKSYKVYVDVPNPNVGKTVRIGSSSGPTHDREGNRTRDDLTEEEILAGRYERINYGPASSTSHLKFYFQHLSEDEQQKFIDLLNAKKINIGMPGYFYSRPFFIAPPKAS